MSHQFFSKPPPGAQLNFAHPLTRGLVGCWLMNEPGWRAYDCSPYKNHGTLSGFDSPPRRNSHGAVFDGLDDNVDAGNRESLNIVGNLSLEAWINPGSVATTYGTFISKWSSTQSLKQYLLRQETTDIRWYLNNSGTTTKAGATVTNVLSVGTWTHVVAVKDRINMDTYINGIKYSGAGNFTTDNLLGTTTIVEIGHTAGGNRFNGTIGLARIWNRALSKDDIKSLYSSPYSMFIGQ